VVAEQRDNALRAGVSLIVMPGSEALVRTVPALAVELLSNLIDNAIRHGSAGEVVRVAVVDGPLILIEDEGPGIPHSERERVFTRFAQLPRDARSEGSGLGLSIALSLAEAIGAELRLEDGANGAGLRVAIRFPLA
jgi:two-component system, OmpR family, sensor histidine kinase TctE